MRGYTPRKKRFCGLQSPYSRDQITSLLGVITAVVPYYFVMCTLLIDVHERVGLVVVHSILFAFVVFSWLSVSTINPELDEGSISRPSLCVYKDQSVHFCYECYKNVVGIDHHCTWLNTCIGMKNYMHFFSLIFLCTFLLFIQSSVCIYILCSQELSVSIFVWILLLGIFSIVLGCSVGSLLGFHIYLTFIVRKTTYQWVLGNKISDYEIDDNMEVRPNKIDKNIESKGGEPKPWNDPSNYSGEKGIVLMTAPTPGGVGS
jgi:palmitoyltransferase ZDHHC1/11